MSATTPGNSKEGLMDARERQQALEERLAEVTEQARVWRSRAEERQRALDKKWFRIPIGFRRSTQIRQGPAFTKVAAAHTPLYPSIVVASLHVDERIGLVVRESQLLAIDGAAIPACDLVVVERAVFDRYGEQDRADLIKALSAPGVPPVVEITDGDTPPIVASHHVVPIRSLITFDPQVDPVGGEATPGHPADADSVRKRRTAYRERSPERYLEGWLDACGVDYRRAAPHVGCLLVTMRPDELPTAIEQYDSQSWNPRSLVIVAHRFDDQDWAAAADRFSGRPDITMLRRGADTSLGECLNDAAATSRGSVLAKWDDDDHYGPGYLEDAVNALRYTDAGIIVKACQFIYVESKNVTIIKRPGVEETYFDGDASGGSHVFQRRVWEDAPFPHRNRAVDVKFLAGARSVGRRVYSTTRYDFAYRKRVSGSTWQVSDELILAQGEQVFDGPPDDRVDA